MMQCCSTGFARVGDDAPGHLAVGPLHKVISIAALRRFVRRPGWPVKALMTCWSCRTTARLGAGDRPNPSAADEREPLIGEIAHVRPAKSTRR